MKKTITIIGAGMMGSALAFPAAENGHDVRIVGTCLDDEIIDGYIKNRKHEFLNRISMGVLTVEDGSVDLDNLSEAGLEKLKALAAQVDSALSIKNQNEEEGAPGVIKIWTGSKEQYDALEYRYEDTLYYRPFTVWK